MARYYRRRYRTIVRAPKKKWGSNMATLDMSITTTASGTYHYPNILAQNNTENSTPTPIIVKVGNFRIQADVTLSNTSVSDNAFFQLYLYIIFVPQGMAPGSSLEAQNLINNHPEWIMGWRMIDAAPIGPGGSSGTIAGTSKVSISSRLKRNLNSGDAIYAILLAPASSPNTVITLHGKCQFWTCAN